MPLINKIKTIDDSEIEVYDRILSQENVLDILSEALWPDILNLKDAKHAVLLSLASMDDYGDYNNRIHVLLVGPKGTAKSRIIRRVSRILRFPYVGHRLTEVGLTGTINKPGILTQSKVVAIDEMDKIPKTDLDGCLEAMSDGVITISVGGHYQVYDAQVRIIACCNSMNDFRPEYLDRFDIICKLRNPTIDEIKEIAQMKLMSLGTITKGFMNDYTNIRNLFQYIWEYKPDIEFTDMESMLEVIYKYIDDNNEYITPRRIDTIYKTALSLARLRHKNMTDTEIKEAIKILTRYTR